MGSEIEFRSELAVDFIDKMGHDPRLVLAWLAFPPAPPAAEAAQGSVKGRLKFLIDKRHGTPFECSALTVRVHAPIKVWREWHRHRVGWSYNEESGRYKQLEPVFYLPPPDRPLMRREGFKSSNPTLDIATPEEYDLLCASLKYGYRVAYGQYEVMLEAGVDRGLARDVLGVGIYSACYCTCNPRSIMHFLELRTEEAAARRPSKPLWEMHKVAKKLEAIFAEHWPLTYELWNAHGRCAP
jgi:thymidylate synthase (FAD)